MTTGSRWASTLAVAAMLATPVHALQACHVASGPHVRPLVELFTSEGCDSCPPADRWLSAQFPADTGADSAAPIALAFHVDYWDRLGWTDRFASAAYTQRQYDAMRANRATFVYTPQVLLQGHDLQDWQAGGKAAVTAAAARAPVRATIAVEAAPAGGGVTVSVDAEIGDPAARADARLFVAYADSGLASDVKAGENRGKRLVHDHVVRALRAAGGADGQGRIRATFEFSKPGEAGRAPALIAFIQRPSNGDVLQAVALPLDRCGAS